MDDRPGFVEALVEDLQPVRVARSWGSAVGLWAGLSWFFVAGALLTSGPLRTGSVLALAASPRFGFEFILGLATGFAAIWAGLEIGVPGTPHSNRIGLLPLVLLAGWFGIILYGASHPTLEVSMVGKREHCFIQSIVFSTPPYFLALWLLRERVPKRQPRAALLIGAAAAAIPALCMQLACMHDPIHALRFHLSPILVMSLVGACIGHSAWRE